MRSGFSESTTLVMKARVRGSAAQAPLVGSTGSGSRQTPGPVERCRSAT